MPNQKRATKSPTADDGRAIAKNRKRGESAPPSSRAPNERRDGAGHMDRAYAAELHRLGQQAVVPDGKPFIRNSFTEDDLAERLAEQAIETATSGEARALGANDDDA